MPKRDEIYHGEPADIAAELIITGQWDMPGGAR